VERLEEAAPSPDKERRHGRWVEVVERFLGLADQAVALLSPDEQMRVDVPELRRGIPAPELPAGVAGLPRLRVNGVGLVAPGPRLQRRLEASGRMGGPAMRRSERILGTIARLGGWRRIFEKGARQGVPFCRLRFCGFCAFA
jgi:hypothetical protein